MFKFGKFDIDGATVFKTTDLSFAFTNLKCFRPGHVLVAPKRVVQYIADLTPEESIDLARLVRVISAMIKRYYNADQGLCVALQDGRCAGQTVPHVHYHIIPKIPLTPSPHTNKYYQLVRSDLAEVPMLKTYCRSLEEQTAEAKSYSKFLENGEVVETVPFLH